MKPPMFRGFQAAYTRFEHNRRMSKKKRFERLRQLLIKLVMLSTLLIVAIGVPYLIMHGYRRVISSNYFQLRNIHVYGVEHLNKDYIVARGGIVEGTHMFDLDKAKIEEALTSDPWIASVSLEEKLPDTLNVTVTEYHPAAMYVSDSQWKILDPSGFAFKTFEPTDPIADLLKLPLITGPASEHINNEDIRRLVVAGIQFAELYSTYPMEQEYHLSEIHVDPVIGLSLVLDSGLRVQMGTTHLAERLRRLYVVLNTLKKENKRPDYILIDQDSDLDRVTVGNYEL